MTIRNPGRIGLTLAFAVLGGCGVHHRGFECDQGKPGALRNSLRAQELNDQGLRLLEQNTPEEAERRFREALDRDLYYAPAHNNLGLVLLQRNELYEAAWEFNCAAKLTPRAPEPRANLGLLYENLGRLDQAITQYETTVEIEPTNVVAMRHLARVYVKAGRTDDRLKDLLERLFTTPDGGTWDRWARGQLIRLGRPPSTSEPFAD